MLDADRRGQPLDETAGDIHQPAREEAVAHLEEAAVDADDAIAGDAATGPHSEGLGQLLLGDEPRLAGAPDNAGRVAHERGVRLRVVVAGEEGVEATLHLGQGQRAVQVVESALAQRTPKRSIFPRAWGS